MERTGISHRWTSSGLRFPLGKGKVDFPRLIERITGLCGSITIEREISGDEQIKDILEAKKLLEQLI